MESDAQLRRELTDAIANVRRQIEYQSSVPSFYEIGPVTADPGRGEFLTVEEAKAAADAEPWGPVRWDGPISN